MTTQTRNLKFVPTTSRNLATASALVASALAACAAAEQTATGAGGSTITSNGGAAKAATAVAPASFQKPAWLTDFGFGIKESYDDNVFLVSGKGTPERDSWVTTVSPKIGFNFAPLLATEPTVPVLAFGYAPDFVTFHNEPTENYTAHRLANTIKGKYDAFSFNLENGFNFIDGSKESPIYPTATHDDQRSAYSTAGPRERRQQIQDRAKIVFQYDLGKWFVRPVASLLYYDLLTNQRSTAGYQNYADRYDVNGGADVGYRIGPDAAVTLGYRYGHQYQEQYPTAIDKTHTSSPSDYQRVLVGFEGKPFKWLTLSVQAGPDFRTYPRSSATHTIPVVDHHPMKFYGEASVTAAPSANDLITFKSKQWQWVSSTGKLPLYDCSYDLSYKRKLSKKLAVDLGGRIGASDYTRATGSSSKRDDWMYTVTAGVTYAFTPNLSANLAYNLDLGRNAQDDLKLLASPQNPKYREFDHQLVSFGATFKF